MFTTLAKVLKASEMQMMQAICNCYPGRTPEEVKEEVLPIILEGLGSRPRTLSPRFMTFFKNVKTEVRIITGRDALGRFTKA
jgi:hypothetical protein